MPRVEVQETHEEVDTDGGTGGDDQVGEDIVSEFYLGPYIADTPREGLDDDVATAECRVCHDDAVQDHGGREHPLCALWTVTHTQDELRADQKDAEEAQSDKDAFSPPTTEWIQLIIR